MSDSAFYLPDGDAFIATANTAGPWSAKHQHGGPMAALAVAAFERAVAPLFVARMTMEILRPIPVGRVEIELQEQKPGSRTRLYGATMRVDGQEICRASCLAIRRKELGLPRATAESVTGPEAARPIGLPNIAHDVGYHTAMEVRLAEGALGSGQVVTWLRMRVPLVLGQETSPLSRVAIAADSGNGVSARLDWREWVFVNPDLTIHLHRAPAGEWVGLQAITELQPDGVGLAVSVLHDEEGVLGRGLQSLFVDVQGG